MKGTFKLTADRIYNGKGEVRENQYMVLDANGTIKDIQPLPTDVDNSIKKYNGVLVPGFINTHCHLELSHMKGLIPTGTGLVEFIKEVVTKREAHKEIIQDAIFSADKEMYDNGIVAVGDISNVPDSFECKSRSPVKYLTFIEMFDFRQEEDAVRTFNHYLKVYNQLEKFGISGTVVPHAPYSVSRKLFQLINEFNKEKSCPISIHNMETKGENDMFLYNSGEMISFFKNFGISTHELQGISKTAIYYAMQNMDPNKRTLFVHNTLCEEEDISAGMEWNDQIYWTTCPSANLYIENRLPNYRLFADAGSKITIGTDSLTSNWSLNILAEMKTIHKFQSFVKFEELIQWACYNGACALGLENKLGSIEIGKKPGINLLKSVSGETPENLGADLQVKKII
ncbi:MAG: S-adenosylhomocysteine deaminase [Saprospirales bacterium]|nr:MAG: S-adenosylhomocysteine deaminase [Saprospirales bacterium]